MFPLEMFLTLTSLSPLCLSKFLRHSPKKLTIYIKQLKLGHRSMPDLSTSHIWQPMQLNLITSSSSRKSSSRRDNCSSISASSFFCCSTSSLNLFWVISSVSVSVKIRLEQEHRSVKLLLTYLYTCDCTVYLKLMNHRLYYFFESTSSKAL